jgi:hypothetical protein
MMRPEPPWSNVFAALRREALAAGWESDRQIAEHLGLLGPVPEAPEGEALPPEAVEAHERAARKARKDVARWALPGRSWSRAAPPWAVRRLAFLLGRALVILGDEIAIVDEGLARQILAAEDRR